MEGRTGKEIDPSARAVKGNLSFSSPLSDKALNVSQGLILVYV